MNLLFVLFAYSCGFKVIEYCDEIQLLQVQYFEKLCRCIKEILTETERVSLKLPFINKEYSLSRNEFESLIRNGIETSLKECVDCIRNADLDSQDITQFIITGGGSQIGLVKRMMQSFFDVGNVSPKSYIFNTSNVESIFAACKGAFLAPISNIGKSSFTLNI